MAENLSISYFEVKPLKKRRFTEVEDTHATFDIQKLNTSGRLNASFDELNLETCAFPISSKL